MATQQQLLQSLLASAIAENNLAQERLTAAEKDLRAWRDANGGGDAGMVENPVFQSLSGQCSIYRSDVENARKHMISLSQELRLSMTSEAIATPVAPASSIVATSISSPQQSELVFKKDQRTHPPPPKIISNPQRPPDAAVLANAGHDHHQEFPSTASTAASTRPPNPRPHNPPRYTSMHRPHPVDSAASISRPPPPQDPEDAPLNFFRFMARPPFLGTTPSTVSPANRNYVKILIPVKPLFIALLLLEVMGYSIESFTISIWYLLYLPLTLVGLCAALLEDPDLLSKFAWTRFLLQIPEGLHDLVQFGFLGAYATPLQYLIFANILLLKYAIIWFFYLTLRKLWAKYQDYQPVLPASAAAADVDDESTHLLHRQQTATDDLFNDVLVDQSV